MTGIAREVIEDQWLAGIAQNKLLLQHAPSRALTEFADVSISDEADNVFADAENAHFAKRARQYRGSKGQFKPEVFGQDDVWSVKNKPLIITKSDDGYQLRTFSDAGSSDWFLESDEPFRVAAVIDDEPIITTQSGEIVKLDGRSIRLGYHLTTEAHLSARPGVKATYHGGGVISPRFDNSIQLSEDLSIRGRGRIGYDNVYHDLPVFDTQAGQRIAVVDDEGVGHAALKLYDLDGSETNAIDLPHLPVSKHGFRIGVYDWQYFRHTKGDALYIAAYRSPSMNSETSLAVLIATNEILWETSSYGSGEFGRGIGPWGSSTLTMIDGKHCVSFCAKDTLVVLGLQDGSFIREPLLLTDLTKAVMRQQGIFKPQGFDTWSTIDDPFTAYGSVIARDINNDGLDEYIIAGCFGGFGVIDHKFKPLWWKISHFGDVLYRMPAIADLNADGKLELYQSHSDGSVKGYDLLTGAEIGSVLIDGIATDLAAHAGQLIATTNSGKAYVIGWDAGLLRVKDTLESNAALGSPVVTDDGRILIASAEGTLFSLTR
jgi:hypothetical protein